jgi:acetylornithine/succinyldiaminopimelate/putrescine aminotransferase
MLDVSTRDPPTDAAKLAGASLYPCFSRADLSFSHGDGAWLYATDGRRFLDFATGIAVVFKSGKVQVTATT